MLVKIFGGLAILSAFASLLGIGNKKQIFGLTLTEVFLLLSDIFIIIIIMLAVSFL